jgi:hypothetical protein
MVLKEFLNLISHLTGINGLVSDPYYVCCGINIIKNRGALAVHIDGTNQYRMNVCRRESTIHTVVSRGMR